MTRVGFIQDSVYLEHDTGFHIENIQRLEAIATVLEEKEISSRLIPLSPRAATLDELSMVHAREYITQVKNKSDSGGGYFDMDTVASKNTYNTAIYAAGGVLTAIDAVMSCEVNSAFALVRPPGHHATCWRAMGFCVFNNIAIAAKYALVNYNIERIMIVDFDVHHGNGTQDTFYADSNVLYFSTHQYPFYPGTGSVDETGTRGGEGYTVNVPLIAGWGDDEYQSIFEDVLAPVAQRFKPQLILVSAGYDAHWSDTISSMRLSVRGFARLIEILKVLAHTLCQDRLVLTLEGGYHHQALALSVAATFNTLLEDIELDDPLGKKEKGGPTNFDSFLKMVQDKHKICYY